MTPANPNRGIRIRVRCGDSVRQEMNLYLWVALGSAVGGCLRYAIGHELLPHHGSNLPWPTVLINILCSFLIGFFGTLTVTGSR